MKTSFYLREYEDLKLNSSYQINYEKHVIKTLGVRLLVYV